MSSSSFQYEKCRLKLGAGGSGAVFLGRCRDTGSLVAIKRNFCRDVPPPQQVHSWIQHQQQRASPHDGLSSPQQGGASSPPFSSHSALSRSATASQRRHTGTSQAETATGSSSSSPPQHQPPTFEDEQEHHILRRLPPHPNVVPYLGATEQETHYVMELMDSDLRNEMKLGNTAVMDERIVRLIFYELFKGVSHFHRAGLAHRDIKPSNILLKQDWSTAGGALGVRVAVGDFGVAHYAVDAPHRPSINFRGTVYYLAPELLLGKAKANETLAADMWSIGCTMLELLTGAVPFAAESSIQILSLIFARLGTDFKHYPQPMAPVTLLASVDLSPACSDLLTRLLSLDPLNRPTALEALSHPFFLEAREYERLGGLPQAGRSAETALTLRGHVALRAEDYEFRPIQEGRLLTTGSLVEDHTSLRRDRNAAEDAQFHSFNSTASIHLSCQRRQQNVSSDGHVSYANNNHHHLVAGGGGGLDYSSARPFTWSNLRTNALFDSSSCSTAKRSSIGGGPSTGRMQHGEDSSSSVRRNRDGSPQPFAHCNKLLVFDSPQRPLNVMNAEL